MFTQFATTTLGGGLGAFLQDVVPGNLTGSSLAQGLGTFIEESVANDVGLDTSTLADGLGTFLDDAQRQGWT